MSLVAKCSDMSVDKLEQIYRNVCAKEADNENGYFPGTGDEEIFDEEVEDAPLPSASCMGFLDQVRSEAKMMQEDVEEGADDKVHFPDVLDRQIAELPDSGHMKHIFEAESPLDPFRMECSRSPRNSIDRCSLPSTLSEALEIARKGSCLFNALIRLIIRLRSSRGGSDLGWLPNPRSSRKASKGLNWHQLPSYIAQTLLIFHRLMFCPDGIF